MRIANPTYIANEEILWIRADGTEVLIEICIGIPYKSSDCWACPSAHMGLDDRYSDIVGESSFQALHLAMRLIRLRLGHLLDAGDLLTHPKGDRKGWDLSFVDAMFGKV